MADRDLSGTSVASLVARLNAYRSRHREFSVFDDYDAAMSQLRSTTAAHIELLDDSLKSIASRLFTIADQGFFLLRVGEWKLDYVAESLVHSLRESNPLALAYGTRSLVEHIAAMVATLREVEKLVTGLRGQNSVESISELVSRTETFLHRAYYGKSPRVEMETARQALHINDCLEVLKRDLPDIEIAYDFLCEYVHPNYGSNTLVSSGTIATGRLNPFEELHRDTLSRIRECGATCMSYLDGAAGRHASVFVGLKDLVDRCFAPGAKIANVFSRKEANPKGDGASKESAFFFPKARTSLEAKELCATFLQENEYAVWGRSVGGVGEGFIFDVYDTDKGKVWFKVPMIKL